MGLPFTFAGLTTAEMSDLDANFAALGDFCVLPCTLSGTNALSLTLNTNTPTIATYANYLVFYGVATMTNTGPATARVGSLAFLTIYKDTVFGPNVLTGGEMAAGNGVMLVYDSALNIGVGGFHLINPSGGAYPLAAQFTASSTSGLTLPAGELTGSSLGATPALSIITRGGSPSGAFNDTTDTATNIIATIPGAIVGSLFQVLMDNTTGQTQTLVGGTGVTISGLATTAAGVVHVFRGVVTNKVTPAVVFYG